MEKAIELLHDRISALEAHLLSLAIALVEAKLMPTETLIEVMSYGAAYARADASEEAGDHAVNLAAKIQTWAGLGEGRLRQPMALYSAMILSAHPTQRAAQRTLLMQLTPEERADEVAEFLERVRRDYEEKARQASKARRSKKSARPRRKRTAKKRRTPT